MKILCESCGAKIDPDSPWMKTVEAKERTLYFCGSGCKEQHVYYVMALVAAGILKPRINS